MNGNICGTCGYVALEDVQERCPVCGSPKKVFAEGKINTTEDEGSTEKHVPVIKVIKTCGLVGDGCTDVHVRIGETLHPMESDHFITSVDFYVDKKWVSRCQLTLGSNPAASAHIKYRSGKLSVIELCNLHGHWIGETDV